MGGDMSIDYKSRYLLLTKQRERELTQACSIMKKLVDLCECERELGDCVNVNIIEEAKEYLEDMLD